VPETYFNANYTKNPVNLMCVCNVCNSAQPRYHLTHNNAIPPLKYLAYKQCLPGSLALKKSTSTHKIILIGGNLVTFVNVTNDISCKGYDGENPERQRCPNSTTQNTTPKTGKQQAGSSVDGNPRDQGKNAYYSRVY
jgi:hypothetical protein